MIEFEEKWFSTILGYIMLYLSLKNRLDLDAYELTNAFFEEKCTPRPTKEENDKFNNTSVTINRTIVENFVKDYIRKEQAKKRSHFRTQPVEDKHFSPSRTAVDKQIELDDCNYHLDQIRERISGTIRLKVFDLWREDPDASNKEIANKLEISVKAVYRHKDEIKRVGRIYKSEL